MKEPREFAAEIESHANLPDGDEERFSGYGVVGLPFKSGHVLALRRFAASSIGPAYSSIWHRSPAGRWTFFQNTVSEQACSRYFGSAIESVLYQEISIDWNGPRDFSIRSSGERSLEWHVTVKPTVATLFMNAAGSLMPPTWWHDPTVLSLMGAAARVSLGTGEFRLIGHTPNGQTFIANPRRIWIISDSRAVVDGEELGAIGPLAVQGRLGEFLIPQRGIFATVSAFLESYDSDRHVLAMTRSGSNVVN